MDYYDKDTQKTQDEADRLMQEAGVDRALSNLSSGASSALGTAAPAAAAPAASPSFSTQDEASRIMQDAGVDRALGSLASGASAALQPLTTQAQQRPGEQMGQPAASGAMALGNPMRTGPIGTIEDERRRRQRQMMAQRGY